MIKLLFWILQGFTALPGPLGVIRHDQIAWESTCSWDGGIFWGGARIPKSVEAHYLAFGTTRSGKTTTLRLFMQDTLIDVLDPELNTRAMVYDPKREVHGILAGLGLDHVTITLDPYDPRCHGWDPSKDITDQRGARLLAATMVPKRRSEDGAGHFERALRSLIEAVVVACIDQKDRDGTPWSLRDVLNILQDEDLLRSVAGRHSAGKAAIEAHLNGRPEVAKDLKAVAQNFFGDYADIASLWSHAAEEGKSFSINEWINSNKILILPAPLVSDDGDQYDTVSQLNRLIFSIAAARLLTLPEARRETRSQRNYLILDEFRFLGELPGLNQLFCQGASKGVRLVIGVLNLPGLQDALGAERAEEVLDLCSFKAFFRAGSESTAELIAKQFGIARQQVEQHSNGPGGQTTTTYEADRPVLVNLDLLRLPLPQYKPDEGIVTDLTGYYIAPGIGLPNEAFRSTLPMEILYGPEPFLTPVAHGHEFRPRPKDQQRLRRFTASERATLLRTVPPTSAPRRSSVLTRFPAGSTAHLFRSPQKR
jgi:type IV secretory pathway TraG/TraD family ATPase VirD4